MKNPVARRRSAVEIQRGTGNFLGGLPGQQRSAALSVEWAFPQHIIKARTNREAQSNKNGWRPIAHLTGGGLPLIIRVAACRLIVNGATANNKAPATFKWAAAYRQTMWVAT